MYRNKALYPAQVPGVSNTLAMGIASSIDPLPAGLLSYPFRIRPSLSTIVECFKIIALSKLACLLGVIDHHMTSLSSRKRDGV